MSSVAAPPITIALDAMGGDRAPDQNIQGALEYRRAGGTARLLLVGRRDAITGSLEVKRYGPWRRELAGASIPDSEIVDAPDVVAMGEHPSAALRRRSGTSIAVATQLVKDGRAQAVVSAGNTGAAMASGVLILGRIAKIDRPALSQAIPTASGRLLCLLDIGATVDTDARNLLQFAIMGALFMERVHGTVNPSVGLLNLGEEAGKGSRVLQEAEELLRKSGLNFHGNVEGIDIPRGTVNVIVCDGLLGNTVVKAMEGTLDYIRTVLRRDVFGGPLGAVAGVLALPGIRRFRRSFDYEVYGGAPLLGVDGVVIVTHGRARPRMVRYAIDVAERAARSGLVDAIRAGLEERVEMLAARS